MKLLYGDLIDPEAFDQHQVNAHLEAFWRND
jgi:hypothetical protein